jgi:hypothetical protein
VYHLKKAIKYREDDNQKSSSNRNTGDTYARENGNKRYMFSGKQISACDVTNNIHSLNLYLSIALGSFSGQD